MIIQIPFGPGKGITAVSGNGNNETQYRILCSIDLFSLAHEISAETLVFRHGTASWYFNIAAYNYTLF